MRATSLIEKSAPVLDSQSDTGDSIQAWASNVATVTAQLRDNDGAVASLIDNGGQTAAEAQQLIDVLEKGITTLRNPIADTDG